MRFDQVKRVLGQVGARFGAEKAEHAEDAAVGPMDRDGQVAADGDHLGDRQVGRDLVAAGVGHEAGQVAVDDVLAIDFAQIHALAGLDHRLKPRGADGAEDGAAVHEFGQVGNLHPQRFAHCFQR